MENGEIQTRFAQWRKQVGLTIREVQEAVNEHLPDGREIRSSATISHYERSTGRKAPPRADFLAALKDAFPTVNVDWMVTGRGGMFDLGDRQELRGELASDHAAFARFPEAVQDLFMDTLTHWAAFARRPSEGAEPWKEGHMLEAAGDLLFLLEFPAKSIREGRFESERAWEAYLLAMLHAMRLALPDPGDREAHVDLGDTLVRALRETMD